MNLLFLSRAYPPVTGGIETQNYEIASALASLCTTEIIANRRGKWLLPVFLPLAIARSLLLIHRHDAVLLGDGVLAVAGFLLKLVSRKPVICIVHGLDLTYRNRLYQKLWVGFFLPRMDRLIAVGNETIRQGVLRGIPETSFTFIPNGVDPAGATRECTHADLAGVIGRAVTGKVLLTLGRLVKRKGVAWFIENVMPQLGPDVSYIVAGDGREAGAIRTAIRRHGLGERIICTGPVSDRDKEILYSCADIFVQPNIETPGDMEGFGLVVLEAAVHGRVVVAAELEGLKDAIRDGVNGFLVPSGDAAAFRRKIEAVLANPAEMAAFGRQAREYVISHHAWPVIAGKYLDVINDTKNRA